MISLGHDPRPTPRVIPAEAASEDYLLSMRRAAALRSRDWNLPIDGWASSGVEWGGLRTSASGKGTLVEMGRMGPPSRNSLGLGA